VFHEQILIKPKYKAWDVVKIVTVNNKIVDVWILNTDKKMSQRSEVYKYRLRHRGFGGFLRYEKPTVEDVTNFQFDRMVEDSCFIELTIGTRQFKTRGRWIPLNN
jgi:hypothetical protein